MIAQDPHDAAGTGRVLMVEEDAPPVGEETLGRMAVFVGSPDDPADVAAAEAMAVELFGE